MKRSLRAALIFCVFLCMILTANSYALDVTVSDNLSDNILLTQGQTVTGQFDINPAIPDDGDYNLPYDISSASTTFVFYDDNDSSYQGTSYITGSSTYSHSGGGYHQNEYNTYHYYRTYYNYYFDEYEEIQLEVSAEVSTDGTEWFQNDPVYSETNSYSNHTSQKYSYSCGTWGTSTCYYYVYYNYYYDDTYYDVERGYTGALVMTSELSLASIEDLSLDGVVDFSVSATSGDIYFGNGTLTADVNPNPAPVNPVPEPTTMLLIGSGLLAAIGYRKRSKK